MDSLKERARRTRERSPRGIKPKAEQIQFRPVDWPFRVLSAHGLTLGKFPLFRDALAAYNAWGQATAIVIGTYVVCERKAGEA